MLESNNELLKTALDGIFTLQKQTDKVLEELGKFEGKVDASLAKQETRTLHKSINRVVERYRQILLVKDPDLSIEEWRRNPIVSHDVGLIFHDYQNARIEVEVLNLADPATALVATPACFTGVSLALLRGEEERTVATQIRLWYLPWLDKILDPNVVGSAAHYAREAHARLLLLEKAAAESEFGKMYGIEAGSKLFVCTGVNDHRPDSTASEPNPNCTPEFVVLPPEVDPSEHDKILRLARAEKDKVLWSGLSDSRPQMEAPVSSFNFSIQAGINPSFPDQVADFSPPEVEQTRIARFRTCHIMQVPVPGRTGERDRLARDVVIRNVELVLDGRPTGLLQLEVELGPDRRGAPGSLDLPPDSSCSVESQDMIDPAGRLAHMTAMSARSIAERRLEEFRKVAQEINIERARIAFGIQAVMATQAARGKLLELHDRLES
ncbi:hypothetical protein B2G69_00370 [Methylorubrum zatmanii]|nr:hypothetical protein B2G69_00370 [Methylorubrum zatmanii]